MAAQYAHCLVRPSDLMRQQALVRRKHLNVNNAWCVDPLE
jgi:hypothetical protein